METDRRRQDIERDKRFSVGRVIPKIQAESPVDLLNEVDDFETEFAKANLNSLKDWARALDDSLIGRAKQWRNFVIMSGPGKEIYEATLIPGAPQDVFGQYYRYIRAELLQRCGLEYEQPGEASKRKWNAIRIPNNIE